MIFSPRAALLVSLSAICSSVLGQNSTNATLASVSQAFTNALIIPDVISSFNPMGLLGVVFTDQATGTSLNVTPGMNLTTEQTTLEPQFFLTSNMTSFAQQTFVLFIVDPDAPTPQNATEAQFRHLLAQDLQTNGSLGSGALLVNTSAALTEFVMPTPPAGSDPHRYVILLFVQPSNFTTVAPNFVNASTPRNNFNLTTFSQEVGLGSPVAGNFFLTGPDNSTNTTSAPVPSATATNPPTTSTASSATKVTEGSILGVIMIACAVTLGL